MIIIINPLANNIKQAGVNEDNAFEFVFVREYANSNHVEILDSEGNEVFYIDLLKGDCHFVADLPDETYTMQDFYMKYILKWLGIVGKVKTNLLNLNEDIFIPEVNF